MKLLVFLLLISAVSVDARASDSGVAERMESSDVATLPQATPHWVVVTDSWKTGGSRLIDADTGHLVGLVDSAPMSNFLIDPAGRYFLVAETIWTRRNRGRRQDILSLYDRGTLNLSAEIDLPGRLVIGGKDQLLAASRDGRYAYIYDFNPASSISVVDIARRRVVGRTSVPGCGLVFAHGDSSISSLCGDGSLVTTTFAQHGSAATTKTATFFDPERDPLFDHADLDEDGRGFFLSYAGLIYPVSLGDTTPVGVAWSIQSAADLARPTLVPGEIVWRPGGIVPYARHRASGRLFVLMHIGEIYTHDEVAQELWVVDVASRRVTARYKTKLAAAHINVSQDSKPLVYLNGEDTLAVIDPATGIELRRIEHVGFGTLATFDAEANPKKAAHGAIHQ